MPIDIEKLKKDTKNKILYRVMFTLDENNSFYVKEKNGEIKKILVTFPEKIDKIAREKIKDFEKNKKDDSFQYNIKHNNNNIPITVFKIDKKSPHRDVFFDMLKTYLYSYNEKELNENIKENKNIKLNQNKQLKEKEKKNKTKKRIGGSHRKTVKNNHSLLSSFQKEITIIFFEMLLLIKLFHWKTHSYATHKATDELYEKFNEHMDKFIEILLGKTGSRIELTDYKKIPLIDLNNQEQLKQKVIDFKDYLVSLDENKSLQTMSNTDLLNIRDEILGDMNQFLYLLTFK